LIPADRVLGEVARKRLAALKEFSDLGAGFRIAARDLEIRGAGDLLGAEQSGHIAAVGIETYMKILEEAIRELSGESQEPQVSTTFDLPVPMSLPAAYVSDPNLRMEVYRRIATWEGDGRELLHELEDRFGRAPTEVRTLIAVATTKRRAEHLRIQAVLLQDRRLVIRLRRDSKIDVEALVRLVSARAGAEFTPEGTLVVPLEEGVPLLELLSGVLEEVAA
jgi:transcription-repair coupling factor (superfamily II helicase)